LLTEWNLSELVKIYDGHSKLLELIAFYDKLLKPVMYEVGDLWVQGKIDAATEHVCSNTANGLIKVINERTANPTKPNLQCKLLICTPEGKLHNLGCNVIESFLLSKGFKDYYASSSVPADSIIRYIKDLQPDIILVSITLNENIKPARRLIRKIRSSSHITCGRRWGSYEGFIRRQHDRRDNYTKWVTCRLGTFIKHGHKK
jgi:MerR family transcriptional regulator, light-induced transcriptional regulator